MGIKLLFLLLSLFFVALYFCVGKIMEHNKKKKWANDPIMAMILAIIFYMFVLMAVMSFVV